MLADTTHVRIDHRNINRYRAQGYVVCRGMDLTVPLSALSKGSSANVVGVCDRCQKSFTVRWALVVGNERRRALRFIPYKANIQKREKCSIDTITLFNEINKYQEKTK